MEISDFPIAAHEQYARDKESLGAFIDQYQMSPFEVHEIAQQVHILNFKPQIAALDQLFGCDQQSSWAAFSITPEFFSQRTSSSFAVPSFERANKKQADISRIEIQLRQAQQDPKKEHTKLLQEQASCLISLLDTLQQYNADILFARGRLIEFLKG